MVVRNLALNEAYFLSSFIRGLREEIKLSVKLFRPSTLSHAVEQARIQDKAIEPILKKKGNDAKHCRIKIQQSINLVPCSLLPR